MNRQYDLAELIELKSRIQDLRQQNTAIKRKYEKICSSLSYRILRTTRAAIRRHEGPVSLIRRYKALIASSKRKPHAVKAEQTGNRREDPRPGPLPGHGRRFAAGFGHRHAAQRPRQLKAFVPVSADAAILSALRADRRRQSFGRRHARVSGPHQNRVQTESNPKRGKRIVFQSEQPGRRSGGRAVPGLLE